MLLCVLGIVALVRAPLQGTWWFVATPLTEMRNSAAAATELFFAGFSSYKDVVAQNAALREELAAARVELMDRNLLYAENNELKARLGRPGVSDSIHTVLASVVSRPPATPYDRLVLDVGEREGVAVGDLVSAGGSVYVGTVVEVYTTSSRVVLFSSPGETHAALLFTHTASSTRVSQPISVVGQGSGSLKAEVPVGTAVSIGDEVVFQHINPHLIARVTYVEKKGDSSFQTVYLQLPVSVFSLRAVEVRRPATYEE